MANNDGQSHFSAHCFPSLTDASCPRERTEADACNLFQPLYGCNAAPAGQTGAGNGESPSSKNPPDPVMAARGVGFETGYCAGEQEACQNVEASMKPELESFLASFEDLAAFQSLVAETAVHRALELAYLMAELVAGVPSSLDPQALENLRLELEADINTAYAMTLSFHCEDYQTLRQVLAGSELCLPENGSLQIRTDQRQPRNQVTVQMQEKSFEAHARGKLGTCLQKRGHASTS